MAGYQWLIDDERLPRKIPRKMKSLMDSDLSTIHENRNLTTTQRRLREKLQRKQTNEELEQQVSEGACEDGTRPKRRSSKRKRNRKKYKSTINDRDIDPDDKPTSIEGNACNVAHTDKLNKYRSVSDANSHKQTHIDGAHGDALVSQTTTNTASHSKKNTISRLMDRYLENFRRDLGQIPAIEVRGSERKGQLAEMKLKVGMLRIETDMFSTAMSQTLPESIASTPQGSKCEMPCYKHSAERDIRMQRTHTSDVMRRGNYFVNRIFDGILRHIGQRKDLLQSTSRSSAIFSDISIRALWSNTQEKDAFASYIVRLFDLYTSYCLPTKSSEQTSTTPSISRENTIFGIEIQIFRVLALSYLAQLSRDFTTQKPPQVYSSLFSPNRKLSFLDAEVGCPISRINNAFMFQSERKQLLIAGRSCRELLESFTNSHLHQTIGRNVLCSEIMYTIRKMLAANQSLPNSVMSVELVIRENDGNYFTSRRFEESEEIDNSLQNTSAEDDQLESQSQGSDFCDDSDHQENYGIRLCLSLD